jgi:hypothetical protein
LSVCPLATFPLRFPGQVIIGIESSKLWLAKQSEGRKSSNNEDVKLLKASDNWLSLLEKPVYEPSFGNQSRK